MTSDKIDYVFSRFHVTNGERVIVKCVLLYSLRCLHYTHSFDTIIPTRVHAGWRIMYVLNLFICLAFDNTSSLNHFDGWREDESENWSFSRKSNNRNQNKRNHIINPFFGRIWRKVGIIIVDNTKMDHRINNNSSSSSSSLLVPVATARSTSPFDNDNDDTSNNKTEC